MRLVLWHLRRNPEQLAAQRGVLLSALVEHVVNAKAKPASAVLSAYEPVLATATHDEFSGQLLLAALRMMKRSPEATLPTVAALCRSVRLDLSQHADALQEPLAPLVRHLKEPVR